MRYLKDFTQYINENKQFSPNIISSLTNKFKADKETLNKIHIFGLYRNTPPFLGKDIMQISSDELNNLYDTWFSNTVQKISSSNGSLTGNTDMIERYIKAFVKNINADTKPFNYKNYEQTLVDIVNNNGWIKSNEIKSLYSITNPNKEDVMYNDSNISIVKGDTKSKCMIYGNGYTWCISQSDLNYYTSYRIDSGATIYFVLNKHLDISHKERLCVIMRYSNDKFSIADKTNSGDRSGAKESAISYEKLADELPWLKNMEIYMPYKKPSLKERKYSKSVKEYIHSSDLKRYIVDISEELGVDYVDFFRDYYIQNGIMVNQMNSLDDKMVIQLIEVNKKLDNGIINQLSPIHKVRYATLRIRNGNEIDLSYFTEDEIDRVISNCEDELNDTTIRNIVLSTKLKRDKAGYFVSKVYKNVEINDNNFMNILTSSPIDKQLDVLFNTILPKLNNNSGEYTLKILKGINDSNNQLEFFRNYGINNIYFDHLSSYVGAIFIDFDVKYEIAKLIFDKYKTRLNVLSIAEEFGYVVQKLNRPMIDKLFGYIKPFIVENSIVFHRKLQDALITYVDILSLRYNTIYHVDKSYVEDDNKNNCLLYLTDDKLFSDICEKAIGGTQDIRDKKAIYDIVPKKFQNKLLKKYPMLG